MASESHRDDRVDIYSAGRAVDLTIRTATIAVDAVLAVERSAVPLV